VACARRGPFGGIGTSAIIGAAGRRRTFPAVTGASLAPAGASRVAGDVTAYTLLGYPMAIAIESYVSEWEVTRQRRQAGPAAEGS